MEKIAVLYYDIVGKGVEVENCIEFFDRLYIKEIEECGVKAYAVTGVKENEAEEVRKIVGVFRKRSAAESAMMDIELDEINDFANSVSVMSYTEWVEETTGLKFIEYAEKKIKETSYVLNKEIEKEDLKNDDSLKEC